MEDEILGRQLLWDQEIEWDRRVEESYKNLGILPASILFEYEEEEEIPLAFDITGNPMYIVAAVKNNRKKREIIGDTIHELQSYART